ncbi:hypothetical protein [Mucilaginibacter gossypiicola]|nr:hypothetical protein [Mucilaginibacter gossypiicola]
MVKIKEGYVMSASEKGEFERQDALPRRTSGKVDYYFKPETKYPARIYAFMQAELWCDRNRRPMGLYHAFPFLSRPMNREELEYHHFNWRLCYHQYERWDKLLVAEEREAAELDKEVPGSGTEFLKKRRSFRDLYQLKGPEPQQAAMPPTEPVGTTVPKPAEAAHPPTVIDLDGNEDEVLGRIVACHHIFSAGAISEAMKREQQGANRKVILLALRFRYRQAAGEIDSHKMPDAGALRKRAAAALACTRCNFVRRVFQHNPLFAPAEIRRRYPGYDESMLIADTRPRAKKERRRKHKPVTDLRRCQLQKLASLLRNGNLSPAEYDKTCHRIALLQQAHEERSPIRLCVKLEGETSEYSFHWRTRENVIKSFVSLANSTGMTHECLGGHSRDMGSSSCSF